MILGYEVGHEFRIWGNELGCGMRSGEEGRRLCVRNRSFSH